MTEADAGNPIAYLVLEPGTAVVDAEGAPVGKVKKVLSVPSEDVFDGIVIDTAHGTRFIDADAVGRLYERRAELKITAAEVAERPQHEVSPEAFEAEFKGKDNLDWRENGE